MHSRAQLWATSSAALAFISSACWVAYEYAAWQHRFAVGVEPTAAALTHLPTHSAPGRQSDGVPTRATSMAATISVEQYLPGKMFGRLLMEADKLPQYPDIVKLRTDFNRYQWNLQLVKAESLNELDQVQREALIQVLAEAEIAAGDLRQRAARENLSPEVVANMRQELKLARTQEISSLVGADRAAMINYDLENLSRYHQIGLPKDRLKIFGFPPDALPKGQIEAIGGMVSDQLRSGQISTNGDIEILRAKVKTQFPDVSDNLLGVVRDYWVEYELTFNKSIYK